MSIIVQGDEVILEQIIKQLDKLEEVMRVDHIEEHDSVLQRACLCQAACAVSLDERRHPSAVQPVRGPHR